MPNRRRSRSLSRQMQDSIDDESATPYEKLRYEWEQAVTDELEMLYKRIEEISQSLEHDDQASPRVSKVQIGRAQNSVGDERIDALSEKITKDNESRVNEKRENDKKFQMLENKIDELNRQNKILSENYRKLQLEIVDSEDLKLLKVYVNKQIEDVIEVNEQNLNQFKESLSPKNLINQNNNNSDSVKRNIKINIPKFKGTENERPMKFLNELEKYLTFIKPNDSEFTCIVTQALEDEAQAWWYIQENNTKNFDEFKEKFTERYWNATTQKTARRKFEFGQYYENNKLNRVNYATYLFGLIKELDMTSPEDEIVNKICDHYNREIRHAFAGQQIKNQAILFKILADFDEDDAKDKARKASCYRTYGQNNVNNSNNLSNQNRENFTRNKPFTASNNVNRNWQTNAMKLNDKSKQYSLNVNNKHDESRYIAQGAKPKIISTEKLKFPVSNQVLKKSYAGIDPLGINNPENQAWGLSRNNKPGNEN